MPLIISTTLFIHAEYLCNTNLQQYSRGGSFSIKLPPYGVPNCYRKAEKLVGATSIRNGRKPYQGATWAHTYSAVNNRQNIHDYRRK